MKNCYSPSFYVLMDKMATILRENLALYQKEWNSLDAGRTITQSDLNERLERLIIVGSNVFIRCLSVFEHLVKYYLVKVLELDLQIMPPIVLRYKKLLKKYNDQVPLAQLIKELKDCSIISGSSSELLFNLNNMRNDIVHNGGYAQCDRIINLPNYKQSIAKGKPYLISYTDYDQIIIDMIGPIDEFVSNFVSKHIVAHYKSKYYVEGPFS